VTFVTHSEGYSAFVSSAGRRMTIFPAGLNHSPGLVIPSDVRRHFARFFDSESESPEDMVGKRERPAGEELSLKQLKDRKLRCPVRIRAVPECNCVSAKGAHASHAKGRASHAVKPDSISRKRLEPRPLYGKGNQGDGRPACETEENRAYTVPQEFHRIGVESDGGHRDTDAKFPYSVKG